MSLSSLLTKTKTLGFSGSVDKFNQEHYDIFKSIKNNISEKAFISIGSLSKFDYFIQEQFSTSLDSYSRLNIFNVFSGKYGSGKQAFIRCTEDKVLSVDSSSGVWISFPSKSAPSGIKPSDKAYKCFYESEDVWASIAFALGLGLKTIIFLPEYVSLPFSWKFKAKKIDKNIYFFDSSVFHKFNF